MLGEVGTNPDSGRYTGYGTSMPLVICMLMAICANQILNSSRNYMVYIFLTHELVIYISM